MQKIFKLFYFNIREIIEYKMNFLFWIFWMILNDIIFFTIFFIYIDYFKNSWLSIWDFLIIWSIWAIYFWVIHWLFANLSELWNIIEQWKLDYFLSFPINSLWFLMTRKIGYFWIWDIFFWILTFFIYFFLYSNRNIVIIVVWFLVCFFWSIFVVWISLLISSISFYLEKWTFVSEILLDLFFWFSIWPYKVYENIKIVFVVICTLWIFISTLIPVKLIKWEIDLFYLFIFSIVCISTLILWICIFYKWIEKYSSWNLVNQM